MFNLKKQTEAAYILSSVWRHGNPKCSPGLHLPNHLHEIRLSERARTCWHPTLLWVSYAWKHADVSSKFHVWFSRLDMWEVMSSAKDRKGKQIMGWRRERYVGEGGSSCHTFYFSTIWAWTDLCGLKTHILFCFIPIYSSSKNIGSY